MKRTAITAAVILYLAALLTWGQQATNRKMNMTSYPGKTLAQMPQQAPAPHPATAALANPPIITGSVGPVSLSHSMILSNEDEHGCNYAFYWDAAKSICSIRMHFPAEVTCVPVVGGDLVCSYKPTPKP